MSLSRSRRSAKAVNYFDAENAASDDDDFCDFTPPSKKVKESKMKCPRETKPDELTISHESSIAESPKQRLSVEERKFQRELELALVLSSSSSEPFQGFNKKKEDKENELESFSPLRKSVVVDVEVHPLPEMDNAGAAVVIHNIDNKKETLNQNQNGFKTKVPIIIIDNKDVLLENEDFKKTEIKPRKKKKVNFIDDDSDSFSEIEVEESYKSETDESDYFPSPSKSKKKKERKKSVKKSKNKEVKPIKEERKPLMMKQTLTGVEISSKLKKKESTSKNKDPEPSELLPKISANSPVTPEVTTSLSGKKINISSKPNAPSDGKSQGLPTAPSDVKSQSLTKIASQSLLLKPSLNLSPKGPARIGLRLGLSRKVALKSLHPNASVK